MDRGIKVGNRDGLWEIVLDLYRYYVEECFQGFGEDEKILFNKRVNTVGFYWFDQKAQKLFYISVRKRMLFLWKK